MKNFRIKLFRPRPQIIGRGSANEKGFGYDLFYSRAGANYEPDMGFEFRKNYYMYGTKLKYGIIGSEN